MVFVLGNLLRRAWGRIMDMKEFEAVKNLTYLEYCDYLQKKYGIGRADYMTKSFNKNSKCSRTVDGLIAHHKMEDRMIMLSVKDYAMICPFEWQQKENIVYCDYLEHLLLHVLICKYPSPKKLPIADVGIGGVVDFIAPELNDLYSGWKTKQPWRLNCHNKVIEDKDVYLEIIKIFIGYLKDERKLPVDILFTSFNEKYGGWSIEKNLDLYEEFDKLWDAA